MEIRAYLICLSLLFVACTKSPDPAPVPVHQKTDEELIREHMDKARQRNCHEGSRGVGIIAGEKLASDSRIARSTVLIQSNLGNNRVSNCTGTIISKHMILTAAHCFPSEKVKATVYFSTDPFCQAAKDQLVRLEAKRIDRHEVYEQMEVENEKNRKHESDEYYATTVMAKYDVALLELQSAVPWGYQPIKILDAQSDDLNSSPLFVAAGFGVTTGFGQDDEQDPMLRFATLTMKKELNAKEANLLIESGLLPSELKRFYFSDQVQKSGICSGDSGGPLFRSNGFDLEQVGIASYVFDANLQNNPCAYSGVHVKINTLRDWLKQGFSLSQAGDSNPF